MNGISLSGNRDTSALFTATFLLLAVSALMALHAGGWLTPQRRGMLTIVLLAVLFASIPDLRGALHGGHDGEFHTGRLLNLVHALRDGQFPVRLGAYLQNGYGTVFSAFYPDLFLYIPALMICAGASFTYSYHVFFILMHLTAALSMWAAASRIFRSEAAGTASAVLYTLAQYRLMNIYTRFAVGESLAMSFLPLFALGLYEVMFGDKRRWKLLSVSALLICQSHLITTIICGLTAVGLGMAFIVKIMKEKRLLPILLAILFAVLLNAFFFGPMLTYRAQNLWMVWTGQDLMEEAIAPAQLLLLGEAQSETDVAGLKNYAIGLGLPLVIMAGAAVYAALTRIKRMQEDGGALVLCAAGVVFSIMATRLFPWDALNHRLGGVLSWLQFPWRMLVYASLCFALAGGYAMARVKDAPPMQFALLALCAACALPLLSGEARQGGGIRENHLPYWDQRFGDYSLPGSVLNILGETDPIGSPGVAVTRYRKTGTSIDAWVTAEEGGTLDLPLYAFDGYEALLDGEAVEIGHNDTQHMRIALQAGTDARLTVRYVGKAWWRILDALSLLTAFGLAAHGVCCRINVGACSRRRAD